jgi:hypothetical protein
MQASSAHLNRSENHANNAKRFMKTQETSEKMRANLERCWAWVLGPYLPSSPNETFRFKVNITCIKENHSSKSEDLQERGFVSPRAQCS